MIKILIGGSPCTYWSIARTGQKNSKIDRETEPEGLGWELFRNYLIAKEKFQPDFFLYENNNSIYFCYTEREYFEIVDGKIKSSGLNGNNAIPVVEYPNNARRLSDIEITIPITDSINTLSSDRVNGIEQFVSAWIKFVNCEIDKDTFSQMRLEGALVVKSNNGENKADVDVMN